MDFLDHKQEWSEYQLEQLFERLFDRKFDDSIGDIYDIAKEAIREDMALERIEDNLVYLENSITDINKTIQAEVETDEDLNFSDTEKIRLLLASGVIESLKSRMYECGETSNKQLARILINLGLVKSNNVSSIDSTLSNMGKGTVAKESKNTLKNLQKLKLSK